MITTICNYCEDHDADEEAFEELCVRLAMAPSQAAPLPDPSVPCSPLMERLNDFARTAWSMVCAMDPCGSSGTPFVWAALRYAVRISDYEQIMPAQSRRCLVLATLCAARLLSEQDRTLEGLPEIVQQARQTTFGWFCFVSVALILLCFRGRGMSSIRNSLSLRCGPVIARVVNLELPATSAHVIDPQQVQCSRLQDTLWICSAFYRLQKVL